MAEQEVLVQRLISRGTILRLPLLAVIDLVIRLISSKIITEETMINAYFLIGVLLLFLLLPDTFLDQVIKGLFCYLVMEILVPNNSPEYSLLANFTRMKVNIGQVETLFINMHIPCVLLLMGMSILCSLVNSFMLRTEISWKQFLGKLFIISLGQYYIYIVYANLKTRSIFIKGIVNALYVISACYLTACLSNLERKVSILLVVIYFTSVYVEVEKLSLVIVGIAIMSFACYFYSTNKQTYFIYFHNIRRHLTNKPLERLIYQGVAIMTCYSILICICIIISVIFNMRSQDLAVPYNVST